MRKRYRRAIVSAGLILVSLQGLSPQSAEEGERVFISPRIGMMQSTALAYPGELQFVIAHRFGEVGGGFYDLFGMDLATIRLGFDYGFTESFSAGIGRSSFGKTYDAFVKFNPVAKRSNSLPFEVAGIFGVSVNTLRGIYPEENNSVTDRSSIFLQLAVARRLGAFSLQLSPVVLRDNYETRLDSYLTVFATPLTASMKVTRRTSVTVQYIPVFNQPGFFGENPLSVGLDIDTGGHQFQLGLSNSTGMFEKAVLTDTRGSWLDGKIYFGFNLVRVFYLK